MTGSFDHLRTARTVVVTTYRRDGRGVPTPVNVAVDDDGEHAFIRTWATSGKAKRLRHTSTLDIAPSTVRGKPTGPGMGAFARLLDGEEAAAAGRRLAAKHPLLHRRLVPWIHQVRKLQTVHYELTAAKSLSANDGGI